VTALKYGKSAIAVSLKKRSETVVSERMEMDNRKLSTQELAQDILSDYFGLQRVVFGCPDAMSRMGQDRWTWADCAELTRVMGTGCHNLSEIAGGHWGPVGDASTEDDLRAGLERECRWLYNHADTLRYPASWETSSDIFRRWTYFWDQVASVLGVPAKYGTPLARTESQDRREMRMQTEMENDGWQFSSPAWIRLFYPGRFLVAPPIQTDAVYAPESAAK
jgi:hypothetical protein